MSFKDETIFEMISAIDSEPDSLTLDENPYKNRVFSLKKYETKLLAQAAVFGGNASGKSNLFKALRFIKDFIVEPGDAYSEIQTAPFILAKESLQQPSEFTILIYVESDTSDENRSSEEIGPYDNEISKEDGCVYEYKFTVNKTSVISESLTKIEVQDEILLFARETNNIEFPGISDHTIIEQLKFLFKNTRKNQLFLQAAALFQNDTFIEVFDWFKYNLQLISPDLIFARIKSYLDEKSPFYLESNELLSTLDTSIDHFKVRKISQNFAIGRTLATENISIREGQFTKINDMLTNSNYYITKELGKITAYQVDSYHKTEDGDEISFDISHESEGSQRLFELLPVIAKTADFRNNTVYFIDEIDRSLHPLLTEKLVEIFLRNLDNNHQAQLIFTTHAINLLDKAKIRTDEVWLIDKKNGNKESYLIRLTDFKKMPEIKDVGTSYMYGRLGGIPMLRQ